MKRTLLPTACLMFSALFACSSGRTSQAAPSEHALSIDTPSVKKELIAEKTIMGAERMDSILPLISGKKIAIVANQTSLVNGVHLVDTLIASGVAVQKVFALEHGFRGEVQAGEHIKSGKDPKTGVPIVSLYGNNKKPKAEVLQDVDVIIFDIQDVGARFYTYISSLHYIMESAAENGKTVLVLDRPNPNGFYVDGPVLNTEHKSFVGMHPVPIVHGMTVAEYAQMINGEAWLAGGVQCDLKVVLCSNYDHSVLYELPVKPSPNLVNQAAIYLYPSLCLFEGTFVSVGRGTDFPFQVIGMPDYSPGTFRFTPRSAAAAKKPPHMDVECKGYDLRDSANNVLKTRCINLNWLLTMYANCPDKKIFFENDGMFTLLAGGKLLREQMEKGMSEAEIRKSWEKELTSFMEIRKKYLLYKDF
ncbi:MAG: exo-beta-N-acetylmuramidase NamZ domain-containing protein [Flavobacteriales bacterium]